MTSQRVRSGNAAARTPLRALGVLLALAMLASCSSPEPTDTGVAGPAGASTSPAPGPGEAEESPKGSGGKKEGERGTKTRGDDTDGKGGPATEGSGDSPDGGQPEPDVTDAPGGDGSTGDGGDNTGGDGSDGSAPAGDGSGSGDDAPAAAPLRYPAAGTFSYAQSGYEEFCAGPSCDRQDLPRTQRVTNRISRRDSSSVTVVSEARASSKRMMRTTTRFSRERADVVHILTRFEYGNFRFSEAYAPQPAIEAMRFPFAVGERWSGSWRADTSGTYEVSVAGREQVNAGGRAVSTFKLVMRSQVQGEYRGNLDVVLWVDPETNMPVKSSGRISASNAYGSYESAWEITLSDGPGY